MGNLNCLFIEEEEEPVAFEQEAPKGPQIKTTGKVNDLLTTKDSHPPMSTVERREMPDGVLEIIVHMVDVDKKDIDLELDHYQLKLIAKCIKHVEKPGDKSTKDIYEGTVNREFTVATSYDPHRIKAWYRDKALTISIPPVPPRDMRVRPIKVLVGPSANNKASKLPNHAKVQQLDNPSEYTIILEYNGFHGDDIKVAIQGQILEIVANKDHNVQEKTDESHYQEQFAGDLAHHFHVNEDGDIDNISATFKYGMLTIIIPKFPKVTRRIKVTD